MGRDKNLESSTGPRWASTGRKVSGSDIDTLKFNSPAGFNVGTRGASLGIGELFYGHRTSRRFALPAFLS